MNTQVQPVLQAQKSAETQVLVVDDDVSILGVVSEVLEDDGYAVMTASSGEEAIDLLRDNQYSLVMSDLRLPGVNGVEVLEHVKRVSPRTNVIMITSHASLDTSIDAIKHGAYDYLLKPFEDLSLISSAAKRAIDAYNLDKERSQLIRSLKLSNKELARLNGVLHGLAVRDGLTELFNHRYINEVLEKEIKKAAVEGTNLSLIFIDVDKFKVFNDENGHQNGDVLLRELSALMRENVRNKDVIARWGGEEFVVVAPNTDERVATHLADTLRVMIADHLFMKDVKRANMRVTISAGVASLRMHKTKSALLEAADAALYEAKRKGRNQVSTAP
ncbi:MAG: diguanylate cyclase [Gammaproteobacteria bacterium]|nr:diguanylate cyclase [Gammaproteobacteria bacterium]